jgi:hypothetical protein
LAHGTDVWVARLGVPIRLETPEATAISQSAMAREYQGYAYRDLRPHIISIGNEGALRTSGPYGTSKADVETILTEDFPRITKGWKRKRLLLYAHGGLVSEPAAIQRVADYRVALLEAEVYPLAFIWKTDYWTTLKYILEDAVSRRRPEGVLDAAKDFMLGMEKFVRADDELTALFRTRRADWVLAPNTEPPGSPDASAARHHIDFDNDDPTLRATLARILGADEVTEAVPIQRTGAALAARRLQLQR